MLMRGCNDPNPLQEAEVLGAVHLMKLHLSAHPAAGVQDAPKVAVASRAMPGSA